MSDQMQGQAEEYRRIQAASDVDRLKTEVAILKAQMKMLLDERQSKPQAALLSRTS